MPGFHIALLRRGATMRFVVLLAGLLLALSSGFTFTKSSTTNESIKSGSASRNSRGHKIRRNERVVFFPTSAYQNRENKNQWIVPIHGWIFDEERRIFSRRVFMALLKAAFNRKPQPEQEQPYYYCCCCSHNHCHGCWDRENNPRREELTKYLAEIPRSSSLCCCTTDANNPKR